MELFDEEGICYTYNSGNCLKTITDSKGNLVASEELGENASIDKTSVEDYHYYHLNEHEDVEYITGNDSKIANAYTYDAFGNLISTTNGNGNRSTIMLYAYCRNLPIGYEDPSGHFCHDKETAIKILDVNGKKDPLKSYDEYRAKYKNAKETRAAIEKEFGQLTLAQRAQLKGFLGIKTTKNGGPDFSGTDYIYKSPDGRELFFEIELTGSRKKDFDAVFEKVIQEYSFAPKLREELKNVYTWHHVDDFTIKKVNIIVQSNWYKQILIKQVIPIRTL